MFLTNFLKTWMDSILGKIITTLTALNIVCKH